MGQTTARENWGIIMSKSLKSKMLMGCLICGGAMLFVLYPLSSAEAVTINHTRDAASAIVPNLTTNEFSGVGSVGTYGGCSGTAIAQNVVLTAAHCISPTSNNSAFSITFSDASSFTSTAIATVFPGYDKNKNPFNQTGVPDLAILTLNTLLPSYVKTYAIASFVSVPVGALISLVGYGNTGTGNTGQIANTWSRTVKREGANVIDKVESGGNFFTADFDGGGQNTLGGGSVGLLESSTAQGDSGGPAFYNPAEDLERAFAIGKIPAGTQVKAVPDLNYVLGVTSWGTRYGSQTHASYGTTATWAFAGKHRDWILGFSSSIVIASLLPFFLDPNDDRTQLAGISWDDPPVVVPEVPIPAALPLFAAGLSAMGFMGWRRKRRTT